MDPASRSAYSETIFISALGLGQICAWGTLYYSYPLIVEAIMQDLGWTRSQAYAPATLGLILAAFLTYPVGVAVDRGYGRAVLVGSSLLASLLFMVWSQVESLLAFYLVATALGALQATTLYEPAFAVLARRVGAERARRGITQITLWGGFSSTVFIPAVQWVLGEWGWRETLIFLAAINFLLCFLYGCQIDSRRDKSGVAADTRTDRARDHAILRDMLKNPVFRLLLLAMLAYAGAFSAFTFHMYPMLLEAGLSVRDVVLALACIGPAQVAGRILISVFAERTSMRRIGSITVAVLPPVFIALAVFGDDFAAVVVLCCVYGAANGIFTIVRSLVVPEMLTVHAYGALNGLINLPATLARALAPWATAVLWSLTESYGPVLWTITATFLVLAVAFWAAALAASPYRGI